MGALRITGGLLFLATVGVAVWLATAAGVRTAFQDFAHQPVLGPLVVVVVVALLVTVLVPRSVLALTAGLVLGPVLGSVTVLAGLLIASVLGFTLGRWLGRDALSRSRYWRTVDRAVAGRGSRGAALVRLLPGPPYGLASMLLGAGTLRLRSFLLGSMLGTAPNTIGYAAAGGAVVSAGWAAAFSALVGTVGIGAGIVVALLERQRLAEQAAARPPARR
jgi:uncharacterized membrane protein YdjX (TVP38/TMEM64 family)